MRPFERSWVVLLANAERPDQACVVSNGFVSEFHRLSDEGEG
jgi:hypothetical protein